MGRRTLDNIERKIIRQTIRLGAEGGLDHISTIELAKKVGISEGTIFVHFKTKENLIYETYKFCENIIKEPLNGLLTKAETKEELYDYWLTVVEKLIGKPNVALFLYNYFISKYFIRFAFLENDDIITFMNKWLKKSGNWDFNPKTVLAIWNNLYFATLRYVMFEMVRDKNERIKNSKYAFQTVHAPIFIKYE